MWVRSTHKSPRRSTISARGRIAAAETYHHRALGIFEKTLGPDHILVASTLESLAGVSAGQQRYGQARRLIERALAIREKKLGQWNLTVAEDLNNLASLF